MGVDGLFTDSDLMTIWRAASLAERLTEKHFSLGKDHWKTEPYQILTVDPLDEEEAKLFLDASDLHGLVAAINDGRAAALGMGVWISVQSQS